MRQRWRHLVVELPFGAEETRIQAVLTDQERRGWELVAVDFPMLYFKKESL